MRPRRKECYLMCLNNLVNFLCFTAIFLATVALIIFTSNSSKLISRAKENSKIIPNRILQQILEPKAFLLTSVSPDIQQYTTMSTPKQDNKISALSDRMNDLNNGTVLFEGLASKKNIEKKGNKPSQPDSTLTENEKTDDVTILHNKTCGILPQRDDDSRCGNRIADMKCCEYIWAMNNKDDIIQNLKCSKNRTFGLEGTSAHFPHMAAIGWLLKSQDASKLKKYEFKCTGSLISSNFVVTSASCSTSNDAKVLGKPCIVRLGEEDIEERRLNNYNVQDLEIMNIIPYSKYTLSARYYDIALLELKSTVTFTTKIHPACISTSLSTAQYTKVNVTGWRVTDFKSNKISGNLQISSLNMIKYKTCSEKLNKDKSKVYDDMWPWIRIHQLCASTENGRSDVWKGDPGSPIQIKIKTKSGAMHSVIGVTSMGQIKGTDDLPGIYTSVSSVLSWIEKTVWPEEYERRFEST